MKIHHLFAEQFLQIPLKEAWDFFSSPKNLSVITPPDLDFKILTDLKNAPVYAGLEIEYTVKPLFGIPIKWKTLISEVEELHHFTDKQLKGPYCLWEHTHTFIEQEDGVMMKDLVKYQLPFDMFGNILHKLVVAKRIEEIFKYRRNVLEKMFNQKGELVH